MVLKMIQIMLLYPKTDQVGLLGVKEDNYNLNNSSNKQSNNNNSNE